MKTVDDVRAQHRRALDRAGELIAHVLPGDLAQATPCCGWDLQVLLSHMIGQNEGFATAVRTGEADLSAYSHPVATAGELISLWHRSADRLLAAFADAQAEDQVRLIEIDPNRTVSVTVAANIHLLDTVIHTWDVASSLGYAYRPDAELLAIVAGGATGVPAGAARTKAGAAFAPAVTTDEQDPWFQTLALLGRPGASPDVGDTAH